MLCNWLLLIQFVNMKICSYYSGALLSCLNIFYSSKKALTRNQSGVFLVELGIVLLCLAFFLYVVKEGM